tara:strand:+ start:997 stop:1302 length:306 start_codon:yes stop_codon:yes gene_type:complete
MRIKPNEPGYLERNENYQKYKIQKDKLKKKYPPSLFTASQEARRQIRCTPKEREEYKHYIGKLMDIILKPNSHYQKYIWDTLSKSQKALREFVAKGSTRRK